MTYTIIDVETTGQGNKITEIAIFKHDGSKVIEEFTSLVNPEVLIPDYITALTGIDNNMVANAPTFSEIAEAVLAITQDSVFVAHSVNFDYNVIRNEFKSIGIDFRRPKLCTVRLSRTLLPGFKSYSLGKLCDNLGITIYDRHRARGDAQATVILFEKLLSTEGSHETFNNFLKKSSIEATLPPHLPSAVFEAIPNTPGIYFFRNKKNDILYVGKAKDLKKRVLGHFYNKSEKELNLCRETAYIDFELSGSEIIALLMEDAAIKKYYPPYNKAAKRNPKMYGIISYSDRSGIIHLAYNEIKANSNALITFYSITNCRTYLENLCLQFELCPKYCHLQEGVSHCFHYKITHCNGICRDAETVDDYNHRVNLAIEHITQELKEQVIKTQGRHPEETGFIVINNGNYQGYGFIDTSEQITHMDELTTCLIQQKENADTFKILKSYTKN
jgi:DNA polymerase-3 subunit epsilon